MFTSILLFLNLQSIIVFAQPNQAYNDANQWVNLPNGGISGRPFVTDFSIINNGTTTVQWSGSTSPSNSPPSNWETTAGNINVIISPINMCAANQTSNCYNTPNRVGIDIACITDGIGGSQSDFNLVNKTIFPNCSLTENSIIDITVNLNTFSSLYQWSWMNGNLMYWNSNTDGSGNTLIRMKFQPVQTPSVDMNTLTGFQCCTCDFPSDCDVQTSSKNELNANMFFHCQGSGLTGAVFATQNAVMGAVASSRSANDRTELKYRLVSSHFAPDGSLMKGKINAFIPLNTITGLFPGLTTTAAAVSGLNISRSSDDTGSQDTISIVEWTVADHGSEGVAMRVEGITFSTPTYQVTQVSNSKNNANSILYHSVLNLMMMCISWVTLYSFLDFI